MKQYVVAFLTIFVLSTALVSNAWAIDNGTAQTDGEFVGQPTPRYGNEKQQKIDLPKGWITSNGTDTTDFEFEERILDDKLIERPYVYEIQVGKGESYTIEINPTSEQINQSLGLKIPEEIKEQYRKEGWAIPPEPNSLENYEGMSHAEQTRFRHVRLTILRGLARILHYSQWTIGAGILTKDTLSFAYRKILRKEQLTQDKTMKERRHEAIQKVLTSWNHRLFYQAPLFAGFNQIGFVPITLGAIGLSGARDKGFGGLREFGLAIGYSVPEKAFVFEILAAPENFHSSLAAASVVGVNYKVGAYVEKVTKGHEADTIRNVKSFYPPMLPGFSSDSPTYASFGLSSGFGFPPPPLADFLTFNLTGEKYKLVRFTIPRFIISGLPRIQFGEAGKIAIVAKSDVTRTYNFLTTHFNKWRAQRACRNVFAF